MKKKFLQKYLFILPILIVKIVTNRLLFLSLKESSLRIGFTLVVYAYKTLSCGLDFFRQIIGIIEIGCLWNFRLSQFFCITFCFSNNFKIFTIIHLVDNFSFVRCRSEVCDDSFPDHPISAVHMSRVEIDFYGG